MKWGSKETLIAAVIAGIVASLCCAGPLVLLFLGISGAWISTLTIFAPWRPVTIVITIIFLAIAFWQLFIRQKTCEPGKVCTTPNKLRFQKIIFFILEISSHNSEKL